VAAAAERLATTGLLFRQGVPPHATYLFKHALVQDAPTAPFCASRGARFMPVL
jgi:hypothetical protein